MKVHIIAQILFAILLTSGIAQADELTFSTQIQEPPAVLNSEDGDLVNIDGYKLHGYIGEPMLPEKLVFIALPPDVDESSVSVKVINFDKQTLSGNFNILPAPPIACSDGLSWEGKMNIINGRDMDIYTQNSFFPTQIVQLEGVSQMRKWKFARIKITPVQYNPATGEFQCVTNLNYSLNYTRDAKFAPSPQLMADSSFDAVAGGMFLNYAGASGWYPGATGELGYIRSNETYCIVTTDAIKTNSLKLNDFIVHKETLGFKVKVITEADYGSDQGQQRALNIRKWLKDNYISENITYVLLIGNPDPDHPGSNDSYGDVPMLMCWARRGSSYPDVPTDVFYSDLTGDWDLDGDGYYGEYRDDKGTGGVDFAPEVITGRIPVYSSDLAVLDGILQKTINYQSVQMPIPAWRKKVLLGAAFSNFANEDNNNSKETDKATLTEAMKDDFYTIKGYTYYRLYEKSGLRASPYTCEDPLTRDNVCDEWKNSYGIVSLNGHGSHSGIFRKYWRRDDGDNVPEGNEMTWTTFFDSSRVGTLNDNTPSITTNCACTNGYPEDSNNLGYKMLTSGSIATFTASRVSWYWVGWSGPSQGCCNQNVTYYFNYKLAESTTVSAGFAAAWMRNYLYNGANYYWMNKMDFNIYGDPSVSLFESIHNDKPSAFGEILRTKEAEAIELNLKSSDNFNDGLIYNVCKMPDHGKLEIDDMHVKYIPDAGFTGWDEFKFTVSDGFLTSSEAVVKILVNNLPIAYNSEYTLNEDTITKINVDFSDSNPNDFKLQIITQPAHGVLVGGLEDLKYIPNENYNGTDAFSFLINDGLESSNVASVTLRILPVNDAPSAESFTFMLNSFKKHLIPLEINDVDDTEHTVRLLASPQYGTLEIIGTEIYYKPVYRQMDEDEFTIIVSDGSENSEQVNVKLIMAATSGCSMSENSDYSLVWILIVLVTLGFVRIRRSN